MNFLAHLALSGESEEHLVGNFIADFLKGNQWESLSPIVVQGIQLHRFIDSYTDQHPVFLQSKRRLSGYRHYAPVLVDVFYDHFLAVNWKVFFEESREDFISRSYDILKKYEDQVPQAAQEMITIMIHRDWISRYHLTEGIEEVLLGMSRRTSFPSRMEEAITDLQENYNDFQSEFLKFFPVLQRACLSFLRGEDEG